MYFSIDKASLEALHYYLFLSVADNEGLSLYQFFAKYFEGLRDINLEDFLFFLEYNKKIEPSFAEKIKSEYIKTKATSRQLDVFKKITRLSEDDICFVFNYYLRNSGLASTSEKGMLKGVYDSLSEDESFALKLANHYPEIFDVWESFDGEYEIEEKNHVFSKKWKKLLIVEEDCAEKDAIADKIYILEELVTDELAKDTINQLKKLLEEQLNIDF